MSEATTQEPAFLTAARGGIPHRTPVWIMRQAGRYLPEYRKIREGVDFLTLTKTPDLAAEVTLQPIRRFGMDAAILFSDIMTPVEGMGVPVRFDVGPVVDPPVRSASAVERLIVPDPEESVPFVLETIRILSQELPQDVPLIGFAGAPFTLMCYLVEGRGSKTFPEARAFLHREPEAARLLLDKLADTNLRYLRAQVDAGARALMIFDSWAGLLSEAMYRDFVRPAVERMLSGLDDLGVPRIYFPNLGGHLLPSVADLSADVVQVDWRVPLSTARSILGTDIALQGNLDPTALFAPPAQLCALADTVLEEAGTMGGHIFNLGHGIERTTDPDQVARLVDHLRQRSEEAS
jgi:uroporphyrinogen decarboxylase